MNHMLKNVITFGLIGSLMLPIASFADNADATTTTEKPIKGVEREHNGDFPGKGGHDRLDARLDETIVLYAPELLDEYEQAVEAQKEIRDAISELNKSRFSSQTDGLKSLLTSLKDQLEAGSITRDEAKTQLEAFHETQKANRDSTKTEFDSLKETYNADKDSQKTLMENLKTAIEAEDDAAITSALSAIITALENRTASDQAIYNQMLNQ